jgi:hypothetical protein
MKLLRYYNIKLAMSCPIAPTPFMGATHAKAFLHLIGSLLPSGRAPTPFTGHYMSYLTPLNKMDMNFFG